MIIDQVFSLYDLPKVFILAFLEIILSIDNAVVLSIIVANLPHKLKTKALWIGSLSAFIIRALTLIGFSYIVQYYWIQILGAIYLFYLSISYFFNKSKSFSLTHPVKEFWKAVILVEFFDLIFAFDSIFAGFGFIAGHDGTNVQSKIWIVYLGGMIGLLSVRYAAHILSYWINKIPKLETSAHLMIGWISLKLAVEVFYHSKTIETVFWIGLITTFICGLFIRTKKHDSI